MIQQPALLHAAADGGRRCWCSSIEWRLQGGRFDTLSGCFGSVAVINRGYVLATALRD